MLKHFGGFLAGIIVGVLVIAVALVGGGYMLLTKDGMMKTVEENVGSSIGMDLNEEQEKLSIMDYGMGILEIFGNLSETPIKDIEGKVGINKISTTISDAVGIEAGVIAESSISNLGATLTNNLTMTVMQDKFEVELPDLPLFQDEEFLSKPLNEAFGDLDQNTLDSFIEVVYDEDATEQNPASSKLIQKLGKKTFKEVSEDMDAIIQDTAIGEVLEITEDSANVLAYLKDTKIGELDGAIKEMKISDAITIRLEDDPETGAKKSSKVLIYLKDFTLDELDGAIKDMTIGDAIEITESSSKVLKYLQNSTLEGLDGNIKQMEIQDAVDVNEETSHAIVWAIRDLKITELGNKDALQPRINGVKLGEVVEVNEDSSKILKALQDTEIGGLSDAMKSLTLEQVMDKYDVGVLSLIDPDTKIQEVGPALSKAVTDTSLYALRQAGVFDYTPVEDTTFNGIIARINKNNGTPNEIIGDFTAGSPVPTRSITHSVFLSATTTLQNTDYYDMVSGLAGYEAAIALEEIPGIKKNGSAYVITPAIVSAIFDAAGISNNHSIIFFVDQGVDLMVQAGETDGEYDNFDKLFSVMYDLDNLTEQGTLYFGKGVRFENNVGGCAVYAADNVKVLDSNDAYVDYVLGENLPIALKVVSKEVTEGSGTVTYTGYNTWISAYNAYGA